MQKNVALFIATASLYAPPRGDFIRECCQLEVCLAFEIEGWDEIRESYGRLHNYCAGVFGEALDAALTESSEKDWACSGSSCRLAMGSKAGTALDFMVGLKMEEPPEEEVAKRLALDFLTQSKKRMEPFYGKAVLAESGAIVFMDKDSVSRMTWLAEVNIRHGSPEDVCDESMSALMARVEAMRIARSSGGVAAAAREPKRL